MSIFTDEVNAYVNPYGASVFDASFCDDPGYVRAALLYGNQKLTVVNLETMSKFSDTNVGATNYNTSMFLSGSDLALANYTNQTTQHVSFDLSGTPTFTPFVSKDYCKFPSKWQQAAGDTGNLRGLIIAYTTVGSLIQFDTVPTCTVITPAGLTGKVLNCIIHKPSSANFLVGTNGGQVLEIDYSGTVVKTITLATTPNSGVAPTISVTSLAISGDTLLVGTANGMLLRYAYTASTLTSSQVVANVGLIETGGVLLSNIFNNRVVVASESASELLGINISIWGVNTSIPYPIDSIVLPLNSGVGNLRGAFLTDLGMYLAHFDGIFFQGMTGTTSTTVATRAQNPPGTDVAQHIYRVRTPRDYMSVMESDSNQSSGSQNVTATHQNEEYMEISSILTPFSNEKSDVRRFKA